MSCFEILSTAVNDRGQVLYSRRVASAAQVVSADNEEDEVPETSVSHAAAEASEEAAAEVWDMMRPLEGDCKLWLKTFDDPEGRVVCALFSWIRTTNLL